MLIGKAIGEFQEFEAAKLRSSLISNGATSSLAERVLEKLLPTLVEVKSTRQIYVRAVSILSSEQTKEAYSYRLKQAVFQLGDTGFPIEQLIAELLALQDFETAKYGIATTTPTKIHPQNDRVGIGHYFAITD
jgi:hypothetical protein